MEYTISKDKITIFDKSQFDPKHILECGQIFRFKKTDGGDYVVFSGEKCCKIISKPNCFEVLTQYPDYFAQFFDLQTDYNAIKHSLSKQNQTLKDATNFGGGIRILNQQPLETIFSFIISANNNIKRIQMLVEKLCAKCGTNKGDFFSFPTLEQILTLSVEDLRVLGMGFRAKYIFETAHKLQKIDMDKLSALPTPELLQLLQTLSGVGPKVADCIALFGYHKMDCFPVDTWVQKIYNIYFSNGKVLTNRAKIRSNLIAMFGPLSGYAQQYLFYFKREIDRAKPHK